MTVGHVPFGDKRAHISRWHNHHPNGRVGAAYGYDTQGRLTSYTPGVPSGYGTISYAWNALGQKTSMTVPLGAQNKAERLDYYYDNTGKMIGMNTTACTLTSPNSSSTTLSATTAAETQFYYDDNQNRVKMVTTSNATAYDGTYYFVYDPTASIPAVVYEQGPTYRYVNVREPDGSLVSRRRYSGDYANMLVQWRYHFDGLGNTVALSAGGGGTTDRYSYDAWGNATHTYGSTTDNPYQYVGQLGYYTHYQEPSLGLLQLGVRYYDPALGRFTSRDALPGLGSTYAYAAGEPLTAADPSGLKTVKLCFAPGGIMNSGSHAWICVDGSCWGFHPRPESSPINGAAGPGVIMNDDDYMTDKHKCSTVVVSNCVYDCIQRTISSDMQGTLMYDLYSLRGYNCASWATGLLARCGFAACWNSGSVYTHIPSHIPSLVESTYMNGACQNAADRACQCARKGQK